MLLNENFIKLTILRSSRILTLQNFYLISSYLSVTIFLEPLRVANLITLEKVSLTFSIFFHDTAPCFYIFFIICIYIYILYFFTYWRGLSALESLF